MTEEAENGNESIDKLEGSLLATRLVLQVLLENGLPSIRFPGDLAGLRDAAQRLLEPNLRYRSPVFQASARTAFDAYFETIPAEARD